MIAGLAVGLLAAWGQSFAGKKILVCGHDAPNAARYLKHAELVRNLPFAAWCVELHADAAGAQVANNHAPFRRLWSRTPWQEEWFAAEAQALAEANRKTGRETFLIVHANDEDIDWHDDAGWQAIVGHFRLAARLARTAGCAGIIFDGEPYPHSKRHVPFAYDRQPEKDRHTFAEYQAKARQRGRETMSAVAAEFPTARLLSYFWHSYVLAGVDHRGPGVLGEDDPAATLAAHHYGLLPAFFHGLLETAPDTIRLIDGNENAYVYTREADYKAAALDIKVGGPALAPPELRDRYGRLVQTGVAVYLDNCWPNQQWSAPIGTLSVRRTLARRLQWALQHSDEYVWLYAEGGRFLPADGATGQGRAKFPLWEERLPGVLDAVADAARPTAFARLAGSLASARRAGTVKELTKNPDFAQTGDDGMPAHWFLWQPEWSHGRVAYDPAARQVTIAGTAGGLASQVQAAAPGQTFHVVAECSLAGGGAPFLALRWLDAQRQELKHDGNAQSYARGPKPGAAGRLLLHGEWDAPAGAAFARLAVGVDGQGGPGHGFAIHEARVYRLDEPPQPAAAVPGPR